jgi:hypothetical protein
MLFLLLENRPPIARAWSAYRVQNLLIILLVGRFDAIQLTVELTRRQDQEVQITPTESQRNESPARRRR